MAAPWLDRTARWAPLTGIVYVVLLVVGGLIAGQEDFLATPEEIVAFFTDDPGTLLWGTYLSMLGIPFFLWFVGSLRSHLRESEGSPGRLSATAFGGGVVAAGALLISLTAQITGAGRADEEGRIGLEMATTLYDLSGFLFGVATALGMAVLLGGTAIVALRHGALPAWLAWVTVVLAIGLVVPVIAWAFNIVALAWVIVVSLWLFTRQSGRVEPRAGTHAIPPPG